MSLPSWERGLKFYVVNHKTHHVNVAPLVGAWIEIVIIAGRVIKENVAPLVGAWIEITLEDLVETQEMGRSPRGSVD